MNTMTGNKVWSYTVAYVSLAVGSGVSIAGNIADTYRIGGESTDTLDIALAAFWPAAVLLAIEMFVSTLWSQARGYQAMRWIGSIGIGFLAMRVSWIHLNELLASRGQTADVATLGPLAIDCLAVMGTALILSGRRNVGNVPAPATVPAPAVPASAPANELPAMADVPWTAPAAVPPLADDLADAAAFWTPERQAAYRTVATDIERPVAVPVVRGKVRRLSVQEREELAGLLVAASTEGAYRTSEVDELLAAYYEVSPRTIRRVRADAGVSPVSAPPAHGAN